MADNINVTPGRTGVAVRATEDTPGVKVPHHIDHQRAALLEALAAIPTGLAAEATLGAVLAALQGALAVTGPLTAAQLATAALATAGGQNAGNTTLAAVLAALQGSLAVTGPLTSAQLATAALATAGRQDTGNAALSSILATLQAQVDLSTTLWTDNSGAFFVRRDVIDQDSGVVTVSFTTPSGSAATPGPGLRPAANEESLARVDALFTAATAGTGYAIGDLISRSVVLDQNASPPAIVATTWVNLTTGAVVSPTPSHLVREVLPLPAGAATSANQTALNTLATAIRDRLIIAPATEARQVEANALAALFQGVVPLTSGVDVTPGRGVAFNCTSPGTVTLKFQDDSTWPINVYEGVTLIERLAVKGYAAGTATVTAVKLP